MKQLDSNLLGHFLSYRGLYKDPSVVGFQLPLLFDVLVLVELTVRFARNVYDPFHPVALPLAAAAIAYLAVMISRLREGGFIRLLMIGVIAITFAIVIPMRTGEPAMTSSYVALAGILSIFYAFGTRAAFVASIVYLIALGYLLFQHSTPVGSSLGYTLAGLTGMSIVLVLTAFVVNHMTLTSDVFRRRADRKSQELQSALASMQYAANAGDIGAFRYSSRDRGWQVNQAFRNIFELPEQAYPYLSVDDITQRFVSSDRTFALQQMGQPAAEGHNTYQIERVSGNRFLATFSGHTIVDDDGEWTHYGIAYVDMEAKISIPE